MSGEAGTLERLALGLGHALKPVADQLEADPIALFTELGLTLPPALVNPGPFMTAVGQTATNAAQIPPVAASLATAIENESVGDIINFGGQLLQIAGQVITGFDHVATALGALAGGLPGVQPADVTAFAGELAERLLDFAILTYLDGYHPMVERALRFIGLTEQTIVAAVAANPSLPGHLERRLRLDRLAALVQNPTQTVAGLYAWGAAAPDVPKILETLYDVIAATGFPVAVDRDVAGTATALRLLIAKVSANPASSPPGLKAELSLGLSDGLRMAVPLSAQWSAGIEVDGALAAGIELDVTPPAQVSVISSTALNGRAMAALYGGPAPGTDRLVLLGASGGTRVDAASVTLRAGASFAWDGTAAKGSAVVEAEVVDGKIVLDLSGADGFLHTLLAAAHVEVPFAATAGWAADRGLYFSGSATLEIELPLHIDLGPINLGALQIGIGIVDGALAVSPSISGTAQLGPIAASVDRLGVAAKLKPSPGNLGPVDLGFAFKPPKGLGLDVDAGVVKGGGYLFFDPDAGEYAGVLELSLEDIVQIKAIGLLTTKMPGGASGFSLLLILTAEFPPIQLGFGFTLNGLGGLGGVNRTMNTDALRSGIRNHTLDSIMFPDDPVARAAQIISDLKAVFPPAQGRYVFGPMLELGWGTPTLVTAELGLILEVPDPIRIGILGQLKAVLPDEDLALVELHLDAIGIIDFGAKSLSIDATLFGSRVLIYTLDGDMALRLNWGDDPSFALSVGGLHPHFPPPPGFPELHRLSLSMGSGDNPRLSCQNYWAITSNSLQFGARVELYAAAAGFGIHGWLGFDVLIIFSPFSFEASMDGGVDLLAGGSPFMGIHLSFILSGPTPWRARGSGSIDILFFSVSVDFDISWGDDHPATLPAVDARTPLLAALADARNWSAQLPEGSELGASLGSVPAPDGTILVHPLGSLGVRQKVVPLGLPLTQFGSGQPDHWNRFAISHVHLNSAEVVSPRVTTERFARGQFQTLSDDDKLSKPSFESFPAGVGFGTSDAKQGHVSGLDVHFETFIVDDVEQPSRRLLLLYLPAVAAFAGQLKLSAAALSPVLNTGQAKYVEPAMRGSIATADVQYVVANTVDLAPATGLLGATGGTHLAAQVALDAHLAAHPQDAGSYQVIAAHEAVAA